VRNGYRYGSATPMRGKSLTCRKALAKFRWSMTISRVGDPEKKKDHYRQVRDLPRIGVAEPLRRGVR